MIKASIFASSKPNSSPSSSHSKPSTPSHTLSETMIEESVHVAELVIKKWDPSGPTSNQMLFRESREEAGDFIRCVEELRRAMHFLVINRSSSGKLVQAQKSMQMAMKRLGNEFHQILETNRERLDPESVSNESSSRSLSSNSKQEDGVFTDNEIGVAVSDLGQIGNCMVSSGYAKECVNIYKLVRKSVLDEELYRIGIRRYSSSSHIRKMGSSVLEDQIKNWLSAVKIAVRSLFNGERLLCDHVFSTSEIMRETCFTHIAKEGAINLLKFPELVATKSKRSPKHVFLLMDMYNEITELVPEIKLIFSYESVSEVILQAFTCLHKLKSSVQTLVSDFEKSIQKDSSRTVTRGGGIHPLTLSVMDFVLSMGDCSKIFNEIAGDECESDSTQIDRIILTLLCKLDTKSRLYKDIALSYLFLANNFHFIAERVRSSSPLMLLLRDDWLLTLDRKVNSYAANYTAMAWAKVLSCLPERLDPSLPGDVIERHITEFRAEIKLALAKELVPTYKEFYDAYLEVVSSKGSMEVLVRYSPDNLGSYLSDLFHGTSMSGGSASSSSSSS
ncbi:hypothetical protein DM860_013527 [Cuscuta australis]|uniref:Exocyst subunit Exo70 family protein n=1 Tax=Cuscuta australis TaxID=267555 RepID=A0A328EEM4_9ASTE|nr:hypothetical protein DM860_013527 [Cuscuta australis]